MKTSPTGATWCGEIELSGDIPERVAVPSAPVYAAARLLVRLHGEPLGYLHAAVVAGQVEVRAAIDAATPAVLRQAADHLASEDLPEHLALTEVPSASPTCRNAPAPDLDVTVVVCTRDRPDLLRKCVERLQQLTYPRLSVIVVDNAPRDDQTRVAFDKVAGGDARFRLVTEPTPGLSFARNRGLREATGDVIAYTDDDVTVDPHWVEGLVRGFHRRDDVGCVTGLVCSASLDGPAQAYFDARVSWSVDCTPHLFHLSEAASQASLFPYSPGIFGTGANFAFRRTALEAVGGFDEALGAGTPTAGGEDLDAFVRILQGGYALAYEPAAVVWHHHRVDLDELRRQMHAYGAGLSAFIVKHVLDRRTRREVLRRVLPGALRLSRIRSGTQKALGEGTPLPPGLLRSEFIGMASGPYLYAKSRRHRPKPAG